MTLVEMKQQRATLYNSMKELMEKYDGKEMEALDKEQYANMDKEFDSLTERINNAEKQLQRERLVGEANDKEERKADIGNERSLFAKALSGNPSDIAEFKNAAPTLGTDAQAGYLTAPVEFVAQLIDGLSNEMFMRQISHITPTLGEGQSLGFPYIATDPADATWTTEVAAAAEETTIAFGRREFKPNRLAKLIKISKTLMNHASMAEGVLTEKIKNTLIAAQESAYMTGDGSGKPLGIFTASASGIPTSRDIVSGTTTALTFDGLITAQMAVKGQYQNRCSWIFHRDAIREIRKLKDSDGQYLWQPSLIAGQPDLLLGRPCYMSEYAPNTFAAGKYLGVYGDFDYYWICDTDTMTIQVLNELYAVNNQNGYLFNYAGDGAPVLAEAFSRITLASA